MVGRENVGEVQFLGSVNVCGLDLDSLVSVDKGRIEVYGLPGGPAAPTKGMGLNVPAILTFRQVTAILAVS